jgi:hypothetical protein
LNVNGPLNWLAIAEGLKLRSTTTGLQGANGSVFATAIPSPEKSIISMPMRLKRGQVGTA